MPIYVYETIPAKTGEKPSIYEIRQSMKEEPLTVHPETGEPIRRIILGGFGILSSTDGKGSSGCRPGCRCG